MVPQPPPHPPPPAIVSSSSSANSEAGRRLLDANEAAPTSYGSGVCFPSFTNTQEFEMYLNGEYFSQVYAPPSDTAGIVLSVFFWVGLAGLGWYLRK